MFQDFHPNYYSEVISTMVSGGIDQFYIGEICKWADLIFFSMGRNLFSNFSGRICVTGNFFPFLMESHVFFPNGLQVPTSTLPKTNSSPLEIGTIRKESSSNRHFFRGFPNFPGVPPSREHIPKMTP